MLLICVFQRKLQNENDTTELEQINDTMINDFREALSAIDISSLLNCSLSTDPSFDYERFGKIITEMYDEYFLEKCVKFDKYKHKLSNWITSEYSNRSNSEMNCTCKNFLKTYSTENSEYERLKHNLKLYNGYLNQCVRAVKKQLYHNEFSKYKNDVRKTWDTLKEIIN